MLFLLVSYFLKNTINGVESKIEFIYSNVEIEVHVLAEAGAWAFNIVSTIQIVDNYYEVKYNFGINVERSECNDTK